MTDKRELIIQRLVAIAQSIDGIRNVFRNKNVGSDSDCPAIIILDGDEAADDNDPHRQTKTPDPRRVGMTPEIYVIHGSTPETIGTILNEYRVKLMVAIMGDDTLQSLCEEIRYEASATDLSRGRSMEGQIGVSFTFTYMMKPWELTQ